LQAFGCALDFWACKCGAMWVGVAFLNPNAPTGAKRVGKIKLFTYSVFLFFPIFFLGLII